jgi:hypothetical protein
MKRIRVGFANTLIQFVDRDKGVKQIYEFGERGTGFPIVIYGPEGCGKSVLLLQAVEVLKEMGYSVIYFNPLRRRFEAEIGIESVKQAILDRLKQASTEHEFARLVWLVIDVAVEALKHRRRRLAVVVDDAFQYLSPREAAAIVKGLLEIIEHPEESYEKIVAIVATSEGLSRFEIGKHLWAWIMPMWNMSKEGFEELYHEVPGSKPSLEDVWGFTGGNPRAFEMLYERGWRIDAVINMLIEGKGLVTIASKWRKWLELAAEDIDTVSDPEFPEELRNELIAKNMIVYPLGSRDPELWIDQPPPEKDPELGIGKHSAWQTPLHREAVRKVLAR